MTNPEPEDDACPGCGDGDRVPNGYWICPVCDAEWNEAEDDHEVQEAEQ